MKIANLFAVILLGMSLTSCFPSKEKIKEKFVESCVAGIDPQTDPKIKDLMKEYCECSGEKVVNKFTASEIAAFEKMSKAEMRAKLMPVIQGCLNELSRKAEAYQQSQGAAAQ